MEIVRKTIWNGHVWLTAVMTVVVQTPHIQCRCPDGHLKPFCLSSMFSGGACCCSGSCCDASGRSRAEHQPAGSQRSCACCEQHESEKASPTSEEPQFHAPGCSKTPAQVQTYSSTHATNTATLLHSTHALPPQLGSLAVSSQIEGLKLWQIHLISPPTDLVITLQHFLI
jgi:hypothetical protein